MKTPSYTFLSINVFSVIKSVWVAFAGLALLSFIFNLSVLMLAIIAIGSYAAYFGVHIGHVRILEANGKSRITINAPFIDEEVVSPILYQAWWNYGFTSRVEISDSKPGKFRAASNRVKVHLYLIDSNGYEITFVENIDADTRFPNEVSYSTDEVDPKVVSVIVQRVDKLFTFFQEHLGDSDFKYLEE